MNYSYFNCALLGIWGFLLCQSRLFCFPPLGLKQLLNDRFSDELGLHASAHLLCMPHASSSPFVFFIFYLPQVLHRSSVWPRSFVPHHSRHRAHHYSDWAGPWARASGTISPSLPHREVHQVELYCHSATCVDIQWNEMPCLAGPRCYINKHKYKHTTLNVRTIFWPT